MTTALKIFAGLIVTWSVFSIIYNQLPPRKRVFEGSHKAMIKTWFRRA